MATRQKPGLAVESDVYRDTRAGRLTGGGTTGNERLTNVVGATLLVLLAVIGVTIIRIHSFFVWGAFMALHVLGHLPGMPAVLRADYGRSAGLSSDVTGRAGRMMALTGALVTGAVPAILMIPEFGPWLHNSRLFHHRP